MDIGGIEMFAKAGWHALVGFGCILVLLVGLLCLAGGAVLALVATGAL